MLPRLHPTPEACPEAQRGRMRWRVIRAIENAASAMWGAVGRAGAALVSLPPPQGKRAIRAVRHRPRKPLLSRWLTAARACNVPVRNLAASQTASARRAEVHE